MVFQRDIVSECLRWIFWNQDMVEILKIRRFWNILTDAGEGEMGRLVEWRGWKIGGGPHVRRGLEKFVAMPSL